MFNVQQRNTVSQRILCFKVCFYVQETYKMYGKWQIQLFYIQYIEFLLLCL